MGTLLSSLPAASIGFGPENHLSKIFGECLADALKRSRQEIDKSGMHNEGILPTTESAAGNLITREKNGNPQTLSKSGIKNTSSVNSIGMPSSKTVDINHNHRNVIGKLADVCELTPSKLALQQQNTVSEPRPFQPEAWPTLSMIHEHLGKHKTLPSTLIFARFLPINSSKKYVEIRYSSVESTDENILETSDKLETLLPPKNESKKGDKKEDKIKYFFQIFKTCLNNLQGQVWWNGLSLILDSNLKNRLKVSALEAQPSQILFELTGIKELEIHRTTHRVELLGQNEGNSANEYKSVRFRGIDVKNVKVKQLRGNLITVHIPGFDAEFIAY